ncbi:hypothetical protein A2U01_0069162, partial [Trifolium medium]|nr:hypothetical protein [Trifolium medium]
EKASLEAEVKKVQDVCDFYLENHPNGYCIPEGVSEEEQAKFMGRPNPYAGWKDQNPRWNQSQQAQQPRKPSGYNS